MNINLNELRTVFPKWPSELDVAKGASNWAMLAQQFFFAASVLHEEQQAASKRMHSNEPLVFTEENQGIFKRAMILRPTLFCAAFALELAAKGAIIRQNGNEGIEHGETLPFGGNGHGVSRLCEQLSELSISDSERICLIQAGEIIANGKYPTGIKPLDNKLSFTPPNFEDFMKVAHPLYEKLMNFKPE